MFCCLVAVKSDEQQGHSSIFQVLERIEKLDISESQLETRSMRQNLYYHECYCHGRWGRI